MVKCPSCGYRNRKAVQFCRECGIVLPGSRARETQPVGLQIPAAMPSSDTRPLAEIDASFAPLPEGALLHDKRYVVVELRDSNEQLNIYMVEDITPVRICPNCRTEIVDLHEQFCSSCGTDVSGINPLCLRYRVRESADAQLLRWKHNCWRRAWNTRP